jgi:hypothetical protein
MAQPNAAIIPAKIHFAVVATYRLGRAGNDQAWCQQKHQSFSTIGGKFMAHSPEVAF